MEEDIPGGGTFLSPSSVLSRDSVAGSRTGRDCRPLNTHLDSRNTKPTDRHPHKALSAAFVRSTPPGKHCDGNGLYLFVKPNGARSWIQRLVIRGRRCDFGLGGVALVSLAEAREKARANRKLAREGGDPLTERRRTRNLPTFAEAAERVVEQKRSGWRHPRQAHDWMASFRRYVFGRIGRMPVSEVTSGDVLEILAPIWHVKSHTAQLVRQRIRTVLEWAVAMEYRTDNPCDRVVSVLGAQDAVVRHRPALPHREVRWAEWPEIDPAAGMWTVPGTRLKTKREHRVPLCGRAKEILEEARTLEDGAARLIFPREGGKPLGSGRLRKLLRWNGIAAVPHGFRSSFRDWAAEETDHPREVVEAALAHVVKNKVEAAYRRTDLLERRRVLMEDWASYLAGGSQQPGGRL